VTEHVQNGEYVDARYTFSVQTDSETGFGFAGEGAITDFRTWARQSYEEAPA
jgi:hypothetical protein